MDSVAVVNFNLLLIPLVTAYTVTYFDCSTISQLGTYQLGEVCQPSSTTNNGNTTVQYKIIQRGNAKEMTGYSCSVTKTKLLNTVEHIPT